MTTVYFIRHAEANNRIRDGRSRPLTDKGLADRRLVTKFLRNKGIDAVLSSPFQRAVDTVAEFADEAGLTVLTSDGFREHECDSEWAKGADFFSFLRRQWADFSHKPDADGESLGEVQERNIAALNDALEKYEGKTIVIGTHGTALSTIINYYDNFYNFDGFMDMVNLMPWAVKMTFDGTACAGMDKISLFAPPAGEFADRGKYRVDTYAAGELRAYRFVVIFARYQDKWLYCRHRERDSYETAGGHIEDGETPLEAAKRELFEETGAVGFDINPAFDYSVHTTSGWSNGQVFLAKIHEMGTLPDFEMAETGLFDTIPDKMRFPQILPVLFARMEDYI